ncbi:MAG: chemotaxis protein CheW [Deltaproteobacteria bacterium]|jgi:chemotaxis signal transduction protein|nr:chemotaxis protein CheW [Deltaproteobacteria bacterium]MCW8893076.1 chemotaxis protein CheW [Deltaproteobacteria bacterium]MCW9049807.1 chemotaxis protein CheW [Deltaproteobacteria bacterium]
MKRFGLFQLGTLDFALSLQQIQKVIQDSKLYQLPRLPLAVAAVLVDNDRLVPLLDLSLLFGGGSTTGTKTLRYQILVESEYGTVALPAELTGKIVAEKKGTLSTEASPKEAWVIGEFDYQNTKYKILDINFLAIEMTQNFWRNKPDTSGARRHPL